jgi:1,4-dihydroxy-2-naphthoate octaprenyltransferase
MLKYIIRALRLPFCSASILPFLFGSLIYRKNFNLTGFILGLIAAISTHLSANLINDYADSRSGADWQDKKFYKFFGGSKLIQEKIFTERFYLKLAIFFGVISFACITILAVILKSPFVVGLYLVIIFLGWSYSAKPFQFSYQRLGEIIIFVLFGLALVMGGYFIQRGIFPDLKSFILSLPFGFLTTAILFVNEVPDYPEDEMAGKFTWVSFSKPKRAFIIYYFLVFAAFVSIVMSVKLGYLHKSSYISFISILLVFRAINILEKEYGDKARLIEPSKLTIMLQAFVGVILIISLIL